MTRVTLYGTIKSPPVRAVLLTLAALDLDYEFKEVDPTVGDHLKPEYLKLNPQHTIPTLVDEGKAISDSHAIMAYLVRKFANSDVLYPREFYVRAVIDQRMHYENGVLFSTLLMNVFKGAVTKEKFEEGLKAISEGYDLLETFLGDHPYMGGEGLTIADFSIASTVSTLDLVAPVAKDWRPRLSAWFERMQNLPYYDEANGKGLRVVNEMLKKKLASM